MIIVWFCYCCVLKAGSKMPTRLSCPHSSPVDRVFGCAKENLDGRCRLLSYPCSSKVFSLIPSFKAFWHEDIEDCAHRARAGSGCMICGQSPDSIPDTVWSLSTVTCGPSGPQALSEWPWWSMGLQDPGPRHWTFQTSWLTFGMKLRKKKAQIWSLWRALTPKNLAAYLEKGVTCKLPEIPKQKRKEDKDLKMWNWRNSTEDRTLALNADNLVSFLGAPNCLLSPAKSDSWG